jgi:chromate transport protein ChrA
VTPLVRRLGGARVPSVPAMETTLSETPPVIRTRRTDGLVGNGLLLSAVVLYLCEFVGIIASHVHTMPTLPGSSAHDIATTYRGQAGATGFLVGWFALVLPGRVLIVVAMRQALLASAADRLADAWRSALDWSVALISLGVVAELAQACVNAGTAAAAGRGDMTTAFALDRVAHYLLVTVYGPSGLALAIVGSAAWRSGVFPRVLAGLLTILGVVQAVNGALLSAPSTASLQDGLTVLNLLGFVVLLWLGVLVFRHRPRTA